MLLCRKGRYIGRHGGGGRGNQASVFTHPPSPGRLGGAGLLVSFLDSCPQRRWGSPGRDRSLYLRGSPSTEWFRLVVCVCRRQFAFLFGPSSVCFSLWFAVSLLFSLVPPPVCQAGVRAGSINVFEWFCSQKGHGRAGLARSSMTASMMCADFT
jgi:hypothetical protein